MGTIYESALLLKTHRGSMHPGGLRLTDRAVRLAGLSEGMRVADIGCGIGVTAAFLSEKHKLNVTGLDQSEKLLRIGRESRPGLELIRWDGGPLPFAENSLDAVFFECTLSVIGNTRQTLALCANALKHTGTLVISDVYAKHSPNAGKAPLSIDAFTGELAGAGYNIVVQEDHTAALRTYVAELREQNGNSLDACSFFGPSCRFRNIRLSELAYMLTIARKI